MRRALTPPVHRVASLAAAVSAAPSVYPTGVTRYDPQKAFNQYVIFSGADNRTHLIDMNGNEVKRWDRPGFPSAILDPKLANGERGHVLLQTADLIVRSALRRKESRGLHYTLDYPLTLPEATDTVLVP